MSLITGQYFDAPTFEGGFEHYEYGAIPVPINGKAMPSVGGLNTNLMTRRRFFQGSVGSKWGEELNVVDERVERAREALKYRVGPQGLWIEEESEIISKNLMMYKVF